MSRFMLVCLLCLTTQFVWSRNLDRGPVRIPSRSLDVANPQDENYVLRNGTIALNITNYGFFGNEGPSWGTPLYDQCTGDWAPPFEYPEGSGAQYMFQGAIWFGANVVEDEDTVRRVSVGTDGWQNPAINEFHAGEGPDQGIVIKSNLPSATDCNGSSIYDPSAIANIEAVAVYSDTLTDEIFVRDDPTDGPHFPLGIKITQTARAWTSPEFARFVILDFTLENIGVHELLDPALGLYLDGDIEQSGQEDQYTDDITGSILYEGDADRLIGWIADNDGRTIQSGEVVLPHAVGFSGLSISQDSTMVNRPGSYNWWKPNPAQELDYGPTWIDGPGWSSERGYPEGDWEKLDLLSWGENDYPQHAMLDDYLSQNDDFPCHPGSDHTWRTGNVDQQHANDLADGYDTRFLLSWNQIGIYDYTDGTGLCHYRLYPGEQVTFSAVLFIGEYFHDPNNPQPDPSNLDPSLFSYDGLLETYSRARQLFDGDYAYQPPTPATDLRATQAADGELPLAWAAPEVGGVAGYRVFGTPDSGNGTRVEFTTDRISAENFTATGLTNGDYILVDVQTEDFTGNHSAPAERMVRVGAIPNNTTLGGESVNGINTLSWSASTDPTFTSYRLVRTSEWDSVGFDGLSANSYTDESVVSGRAYTYTLYLNNSLGITSLPNNSVNLTPYAPEQTVLVYDETKFPNGVELQRGAVYDSLVRNWYMGVLNELNEPYEYLEVSGGGEPLTLETLAMHSVVIWHSENPRQQPYQYDDEREAILQDYVRIGGKLLRFGRQSLMNAGLFPGRNNWEDRLSILAPLTLDSAWASLGHSAPSGDLQEWTIGATSTDASYPSFSWDTAKVAALTFSGNSGYEYLFGIDFFWPNSNTYPLYTVNLHEDDATNFDNAPCGVIGPGVIFLGFPLYFMFEADAQALLAASLEALRMQVLDTPEPPSESLPTSIALKQNYPNPFNPSTTIEFELNVSGNVALHVYNIRGQLVSTVLDGALNAGRHQVLFDATQLSSGLYFYRLETRDVSLTRKMLLLK